MSPSAIFVYFFLFESSKISLEMVDKMYSEPGLKAWKSGKWAPEGYASRKQLIDDEKSESGPAHIEDAERSHSRDSEMTARDPHFTGATMTEKRTGMKPSQYA
jgi:hypothetical protein